MGKDKSILEKFTDKMKDIVNIAEQAANDAIKAEQPPLKGEERTAVYMPLAADGLVSDLMMVPPAAVAPARSRKRSAPKRAATKTASKATPKATKKSARRPAKRSASRTSKKAAKAAAKKADRKTTRNAGKKARKAKRL